MATYNINDLSIRDGRLYAGNVEVGARDTIQYVNPAAPALEGATTMFGGSVPQPTVYGSLPAWALTEERLNQLIPDSPQAPEGYASWLSGPYQDPTSYARTLASSFGNIGDYYSSQVDPILEFANTGSNRDALYGAYMLGSRDNPNAATEERGIANAFGMAGNYYPMSSGMFEDDAELPDLSRWTGEAYNLTPDWEGETSRRAAQEAQQILKQFYPNATQEQLDRAAYAALQKGDKYYNGVSAPSDTSLNRANYYGHGPLPTVTAIAKELGMTPGLEQFLTNNWGTFADRYAADREQIKASEKAEQQGHITSGLAGIGSVLGGAFGLSGLLNGGLGSALGMGAEATQGGTSMFDGLGDWFSGLFDSGTSSASGWDFGPLSDAFTSGGVDPVSGFNLNNALDYMSQGWDFGPISDSLMSGGVDPVSGMTLNQMQPGLLDSVKNYITQNPGSTVKTALQALTNSGAVSPNLLSGLLSGVGGYLSGDSAQDAAKTMADAQLQAARIAADAAKFRPVGVTTRFGQSQFGTDSNGNVNSAGYTLTPDVKAQQDALMGMSGQMLSQYLNAPQAFAPMGVAGQRAMALGNQYLAQDPQAQAMKYMQDQQALLGTGRERDLNNMLTGEFNRGTYGLATGGTSTGMTAANPRLEAMFNAQRQQDLGLAAQATQGGMDYAKFGAGMVGTGGDLTNAMYQGQVNAFNPYRTALGGAQTLEGLGQNAMDLGVNLGKTTNNAQSGMLLANGMNAAAQTMQPANSYSPWGALLSGAGNQVANYQNQQQQQQQQQFQQQMMLAALGQKAGII